MLKKIYRFHSPLDQGTLRQISGTSFLIVHSMPPAGESIRAFGEKLCQAINLNKQELGILAVKDSDFFDFGVLRNCISNGHVVWMSEHPEQYFPNLRIHKYYWFESHGLRIIITDNANELMQDRRMKARLWEALKNEFL
jgi:hypothetical protein